MRAEAGHSEDTRRGPSTNQGKRPQKKPDTTHNLISDFSLQNCEKIHLFGV